MLIIGIAGGSGSGKSTLVSQIRSSPLGSQISVLAHDAYYLPKQAMPTSLRSVQNWDHPDAIDNALFLEHIDALKIGMPVESPIYDFATHQRLEKTHSIAAAPILVVEGILLYVVDSIRSCIDLRVFVDAPAEERIVRRILRDVTERGRTVESVAQQFRETARPMHDAYIEPSRRHAHVILPWDWQCDTTPATEMLLGFFASKLSSQ